MILAIAIREASAKIRTGPPLDEEKDLKGDVWAGEIPLRLTAGQPAAAPGVPAHLPVPSYAANYPGPQPVPG